ncbi:hypothetical protein CBM2633_U10069 [Cupriavidus taiwanensis]|uniref:hypothetical protein n=1 Tax=Cupriavidus taiwanensis TaxID=164546 RepID=UPI000E123E17|nr:hypothetical protein [Cupriavidus taiwanensis]SPA23725.1 hypothetical protein CBM2633_U10069 [Cupriavidus taiwanensis]
MLINEIDHQLVGECDSEEEKRTLWRERSLWFRARRTWNVVQAMFKGQITARSCVRALRYPAFVVFVAMKPSRGGGLLLVCPAAVEAERDSF